jgi:hypothetical protein
MWRFPMGHDRSPSRRKMFRIRNFRRKANEKLRQKINALSVETLRWHRKFLDSENEKAYCLRDAQQSEQYFLQAFSEFWAAHFQAVVAENIQLRRVLLA